MQEVSLLYVGFIASFLAIMGAVQQKRFNRFIKNAEEKAFLPYKRTGGKNRLIWSAAWIIIKLLDLIDTSVDIIRAREYLESDLSYHMRKKITESISEYSLHIICCVMILVFFAIIFINELFALKKKHLVCILPDGVYYEFHHLEPVEIRYAVNGGRVILLNDKDRKIAEGEYTADCEKMLTAYYPSISDIPMSQI